MLPSPTEAAMGQQRSRVYSNNFPRSFFQNRGYLISHEDRPKEDYSYDPTRQEPLKQMIRNLEG
jgi:hypothetical protein